MDSTLRSNLSVGMPLELTVIEKDDLGFRVRRRIYPDDEEFDLISQHWVRRSGVVHVSAERIGLTVPAILSAR